MIDDGRPPEPDDRAPALHRRHVWIRTVYQNPLTGMDEEQPTLCVACGRIKDEAVSRLIRPITALHAALSKEAGRG